MAQPRVLFIAHSHLFAGAERNLLSIIESAQIGGFEPAGLVLPGPGLLAEMAKALPFSLRYVSYHAFRWYHPFKYAQTLWMLRRHIKESQVDIIHLNLQILAEFAIQAGRLTHRPVVCHVRNLQTETTLALLRPWLHRADAILAVSLAVQESLVQGGIVPQKIHLLYDSIDARYFIAPQQTAQLKQQNGLSNDTLLVGFLGRVVPEKGIEDLIEAIRMVLDTHPGIHLFIAGDDGQQGTYLEKIEQKITALNIQSFVTLLGFRTDIPEILADLDVVVVPSPRAMPEGLPYAVLEALAMGRIVIATRNSGVPEVIQNGVNGFLVDCDDVPGLASATTKALAMPKDAREAMKTAARQSVQDRTVENQVRQLGELYRELLDKRRRKGR